MRSRAALKTAREFCSGVGGRGTPSVEAEKLQRLALIGASGGMGLIAPDDPQARLSSA